MAKNPQDNRNQDNRNEELSDNLSDNLSTVDQSTADQLLNNPRLTEHQQLIMVLQGIKDELSLIRKNFQAVTDPGVSLRHFQKGPAIRFDQSQSKIHNKPI